MAGHARSRQGSPWSCLTGMHCAAAQLVRRVRGDSSWPCRDRVGTAMVASAPPITGCRPRLPRWEGVVVVGDGAGTSSGRLVGITGSRGMGAGGLGVDCTVTSSGCCCGRGRCGGGGVDTTVSRGGCWGGVVRLAGGSQVTGCRGAVWPLGPGSGRASSAVMVAGSSSASWPSAWEVGACGSPAGVVAVAAVVRSAGRCAGPGAVSGSDAGGSGWRGRLPRSAAGFV